jgi:hypothetical protein
MGGEEREGKRGREEKGEKEKGGLFYYLLRVHFSLTFTLLLSFPLLFAFVLL